MKIKNIKLSTDELDKQSVVKIHKWLDINSVECKQKDPDIHLTKTWLKIGSEDGFLMIDSLGRIWLVGDDGYHPYHFDYNNQNFGFRIAIKAFN